MIVTRRPNALRLFFALRGSILPRILGSLATCTALAMAVTLSHGELFDAKITLTPVPFSLIGLALAIFLGFRNSAAYDRYWEARKLWGELIFRSRSLARQLLTLTRMEAPPALPPIDALGPIDVRHAIIRRAIAFAHVLRQQLRGIEAPEELRPWLTDAELAAVANSRGATDLLLRLSSRELGDCLRAGQIEPQIAAEVDKQFTGLAEVAAGCERIASTPIPFAYTLLLHRTAYLYCFLLPFGLVDLIGFMTPFVVAIVAYTFFGLDAVGDEIEEPFGVRAHHLPLDAMCRTLEINLLEAMGADELPIGLEPVDGWLH
ncbi:MAG: bestrophin [Methylibium sp.]|uniref:bestrophin family protein n=1 Tax=Methylibium sp. TaxID=2067992 RepID=UPI0017EAF2CC|nr:bestrophin family ion channel [Methylibium sp.]MBA3596972.1 bestrophin [Methylibium sp.]